MSDTIYNDNNNDLIIVCYCNTKMTCHEIIIRITTLKCHNIDKLISNQICNFISIGSEIHTHPNHNFSR